MTEDQPDLIPEGITLRDFEDHKGLRENVFAAAQEGFAKKFPQEYGKFRLEVDNLHYAEKDDFDLATQKKALMTNQFLAKRLRGTLRLYDRETGDLVDEQEKTLMRVPYVTDRGTTIHNGNEYVTLNQARLSSGIYTRRKESGEVEAQINAKRGTGKAYRIRLEPESSLYKMDLDQSSLRLYSLLHDLGVSDEELELRWGSEVLEANRKKYDPRVLDKAYSKLVRNGDPGAGREDKIKAIREALTQTRVSRKSVERTLPNLFNTKQATAWRKAGFAAQVDSAAQNQDEFVKWDQKRQEQEMKAEQQQQKAEAKRDLDARRKLLEIRGLSADLLAEDGSIDELAVVKQLMTNRINKNKAQGDIATKKMVKSIQHNGKKEVETLKAESGIQDSYLDIKDQAEQARVEEEKNELMAQLQSVLGSTSAGPVDPAIGGQDPNMIPQPGAPVKMAGTKALPNLLRAKEHSDQGAYKDKHAEMRNLMWQHPKDFYVDSTQEHTVGVTHRPTKFKVHLPKHVVADLGLDDMSDTGNIARAREIIGLNKAARKENYRQAPTAEPRAIETHKLPDGHEVDIKKLQSLASGTPKKVKLDTLDPGTANRSKSTGFGPNRFEDADQSVPILVDSELKIIDGRHRYFKAVDNGDTEISVIQVTQDDISKAYADDNSPEYSNQQSVEI